MEKWRKIVPWFMIAALVFSFAACGKKMGKGGTAEMPEQVNNLPSDDLYLELGDAAPACGAASTDGSDRKLSDLKGSWVVLYFYSKAFTSG